MDKLNLNLTPAEVSSYTDFEGLARLKTEAQGQSPETLKKVAQQFESLFLEMMLKSMREAKLGDGIFDSDAGDFYQGMFDKQIAMDLANSEGGGLGIAELLVRQLSAKAAAKAQQTHEDGNKDGMPIAPSQSGLPTNRTTQQWQPADPTEFVREVLPHAQAAAAQLGVHPLALVAQAAVETGWGQHVIPTQSGSSFNLFGVKAGESWDGSKVSAGTLEVENGLPVARRAQFRSYDSIADSFGDYVKLLSGARYQEVREQGATLTGFADAIGRSGYATDPQYANKIKGILTGDTLRGALQSLKVSGTEPMI